jgi:hypothetical protein
MRSSMRSFFLPVIGEANILRATSFAPNVDTEERKKKREKRKSKNEHVTLKT